MWALPTTLLLLHIAQLCSASCRLSSHKIESGTLNFGALGLSNTSSCVNVSSHNITNMQGKPPLQIKELDLSHNKLTELPQEFLDFPNLERLYLNDNELKQLPSNIFSKSLRLMVLRLEGNPLTSLSTSAFPKSLTNFSVDCQCELVHITLLHCANNCTLSIECREHSSTGLSNAREFYTQQCGNTHTTHITSISVAIVVSILTLLLVAGVAYFLIRRKKGATFSQDKRTSNASDATHGQPRYLTHSSPQDLDRGTGHQANYENVYIDQTQEARGGSYDHRSQRQPKSRLPPSIENTHNSLADQPIYANTQDVYYNYPGQPASETVDEEVYIMPDQ